MDANTFDTFARDIGDDALTLSSRKRKDYATGDVLSNFKRMAKVAEIAFKVDHVLPADVAYFFLLMKLDRMQNLRGREAANEAVRDSMLDAHNYLNLGMACEIEATTPTE